MRAMILAAGLGTRLRPYTLCRPKPLFPVLDTPLLYWGIGQFFRAGFDELVVNAHHLQEQLVAAAANIGQITVQTEKDILGTGGGLRMASRYFDNAPVLVVNGDIFHTIDLSQVYAWHARENPSVTMVLHDCSRFNNVLVAPDNTIIGFGERETKDASSRFLAFTGIHVVDPAVLERIPSGVFYNIIDLYKELIRDGCRVAAFVVKDHYWTDIGTPKDYLQLHQDMLQGDTALSRGKTSGNPFFVGKNVTLSSQDFTDWVCIGSDAHIGKNARLSRVVVWDGARVPDDSELIDTVVV